LLIIKNKMPQISEKGRQMPASPIRKLTPYADLAKKNGKKIKPMNINTLV